MEDSILKYLFFSMPGGPVGVRRWVIVMLPWAAFLAVYLLYAKDLGRWKCLWLAGIWIAGFVTITTLQLNPYILYAFEYAMLVVLLLMVRIANQYSPLG